MAAPPLIGLAGKAGSGKSTVADYLERYHGYHQFAFADVLKEVVGLAFHLSTQQLYGELKEVIDPRWHHSPRYLLQWLGTDVLRARFPGIWIEHLKGALAKFQDDNGPQPIVVSDVRFLDEAQSLRTMGARLVRLERDGNGAWQGIPGHVSETGLDGYNQWDFIIRNNGTREYLFSQVEVMAHGQAGRGGNRQS